MAAVTGFNVEAFVTLFPPPQRARVTQGFSPPWNPNGEDEEPEEFSTDDVIEFRRSLCPFVTLTFPYPETKETKPISVSTSYTDFFRVVPQQVLGNLPNPYVYRSVKKLMEIWPSTVRAQRNCGLGVDGYYRENDILQLVRITLSYKDSKTYECEFKNTRTLKLFRLPETFVDFYQEIFDDRVYTLQELIESRRVSRVVTLVDSEKISIPWIPKHYCGYIRMEQPRILFELKRVFEDEDNYESPISILPIDMDIELSPRESTYLPMEEIGYDLRYIFQKCKRNPPFVIQVTSWNEHTNVLASNSIFPGNQLLIRKRQKINKILVTCEGKYFLLPTIHDGTFKRFDPATKTISSSIDISTCSNLLPLSVVYYRDEKYINPEEDCLPEEIPLRLLEVIEEESLLVSKLQYSTIWRPFHLPLRTGIKVQVQTTWRQGLNDVALSHRDEYAEEISEELFRELVTKSNIKPSSPENSQSHSIGRSRTLPQPAPRARPSIPSNPESFTPQTAPPSQLSSASVRSLPPSFTSPPQLPPRRAASSREAPRVPPRPAAQKTGTLPRGQTGPAGQPVRPQNQDDGSDSDSDEEHSYSYIDMSTVTPQLNVSNKGPIEIPKDGNLINFSVNDMLIFLRESQVSTENIEKLQQMSLDGRKFSNLDDNELETLGLSSPIIVFFRNRSRALGALAQL